MCWQIVGDSTGAAARVFLQRLKNASAAATILHAAFGYMPSRGRVPPRYQWASMRARRIVAMGLALSALSKPSRKSGPRNAFVHGIGRGAFQCLLADPFDHRPSYEVSVKRTARDGKKYYSRETRVPAQPALTSIYGTHELGATVQSGQVGYFVALRRSRFAYRLQLPKGVAPARECYGPSGCAVSRYWVMGRACSSAATQLLPQARWSLMAAVASAVVMADSIAALEKLRPPDD